MVMTAEGYGTDKVYFKNLEESTDLAFSKSLFLVIPVFDSEQKRIISELSSNLREYNRESKKQKCNEALKNLYKDYLSNIEILQTNLTTPIKFHLSPFQLYHINSNKFLALSDSDSSVENVKLLLVDTPGANTQFKVGETRQEDIGSEYLVNFNLPVKLMAAREVQGFQLKLFCPIATNITTVEPLFSIETEVEVELNYFKTEKEELKTQSLHGGDMILITQLDHNVALSVRSDLESRIRKFSEKLAGRHKAEDFEVALNTFTSKDIMDSIVFTNSIWIIEHIEKPNGSEIKWSDRVRLLNLASGKYLNLNKSLDKMGVMFDLVSLNSKQKKPAKQDRKSLLIDEASPVLPELRKRVEISEEKMNQLTDRLTEDPYESTVFTMSSPTAEDQEYPIQTNDYVSIKSAKSAFYLGIQVLEESSEYKLQPNLKRLDENTFKIIKSDKKSNEISFFQLSTYFSLSDLLFELRDFRINRAYSTSQDLRKKIYSSIKTIWNLKDFLNNKYLVTSIKEKFNQKNSTRQEFLAQQQYILFFSMILSVIFDNYELMVLQDLDVHDSKNESLFDVLNSKTNFENLTKGADYMYRANKKITEKDAEQSFQLLLKAKVYLANQIYEILEDICKGSESNSAIAFGCAVYFMHHFPSLPKCSSLISNLISENKNNALSLRNNLNLSRILDSMPNGANFELDIILSDPNDLLTTNFKNIKTDLLKDKVTTVGRRRLVNPLVYCCALISHWNSPAVKNKCLGFLTNCCEVKGKTFFLTQDIIYRILKTIPGLWERVFSGIKM